MPALHLPSRTARRALIALLAVTTGLGSFAGPALARDEPSTNDRIYRLEKEMQAVQRKVFPGGAGNYVTPEVSTPVQRALPAGTPATSPVADLTARVNAIESQMTQLTGQVEENGHRLKLVEQKYAKLQAAFDAAHAANNPAPLTGNAAMSGSDQTPASGSGKASNTTGATAQKAADGARTKAVAAIERPQGGDAANDSYVYGYRLWDAKFYPEAEAQLKKTVDTYGDSDVASRAQNLLGRAYLDDGKAALAAKTLFENYRKRPNGDRAAESLAWVGEALIQLDRRKDACLAYDELKDRYDATMRPNIREMMTKGRVRAKCSG